MSKNKVLPIESPPSRQPNDGRFQLRVVGEVMTPEYPNGSLVEFRIMDTERESLALGVAYVVWHNDTQPIFRAFVGGDGNEILLAPLNQRKYPGFVAIPRREVSRIAEAVGIVLPAPAPRRPRINRTRRNHAAAK
jgi:phage repressor protein C with HTH and peptisase S24 domain